ncbi:hypothetical protein [Actinoplanes subtropicus]|uniref:hypothetical protein n=1 Tax=Actinoplanes subtropicus TaxID=543632 RepID=UPI0007C4AFE4|nr:hypothetical protein [Actinoplanes subtropicus]
MDEPVTVTVAYQVTPGGADAFSDWAMAMLQEAAQYVEYLGGGILAPGETGDDWHVVSRWSSPEAAKLWEASPARARLVRSASSFAQPARTKRTTGVRAWFDLSSRMATPPPKWKTALVTLAAVFPPVLVFNLTVIPYLGGVPAVLRTLTLCVAVTAVVTWVMMPRLLRLLRNWLNPPPLEAEGVDVGAPEPPGGGGRIAIGRRQRGWSGGETATADFGYGGGDAGPAWLAEVAPRERPAERPDDDWREPPGGPAPWYSSRRQEPEPSYDPSYDPEPRYREQDRGGWYREPQESGSWYREAAEPEPEPEPRRYREEPQPDERYWEEQQPGRWYRERDATEILPAVQDEYDEPEWRPIRQYRR